MAAKSSYAPFKQLNIYQQDVIQHKAVPATKPMIRSTLVTIPLLVWTYYHHYYYYYYESYEDGTVRVMVTMMMIIISIILLVSTSRTNHTTIIRIHSEEKMAIAVMRVVSASR
jgi:hypothetical protein